MEKKYTPHNYAYNIQHTTQSVQCTAKESEHTVPGMQGGPAAGGGALKIRHSALGHSSGVFVVKCRPPFTSLSLRSLRLAHKSTSKLVLLVLVTRVCQAAFREVRSRRGETIGFRGIAAISRAAINILLRCPLPGPPEFSWGAQNAQDALQKSLRERFRRHLRRSCALLRPASLHKSVPDAFWAPFWDPLDPKIYAPVEARA